MRASADALQAQGLALPASKVVGNLNTLLGMLDAGMGVTLLPRSVSSRGSVAKHARIEIEGVDMTRTFGIATASSAKPGGIRAEFYPLPASVGPASAGLIYYAGLSIHSDT